MKPVVGSARGRDRGSCRVTMALFYPYSVEQPTSKTKLHFSRREVNVESNDSVIDIFMSAVKVYLYHIHNIGHNRGCAMIRHELPAIVFSW